MAKKSKKAVEAEPAQVAGFIRTGDRQDVVILFIPSHDHKNKAINDQDQWAQAAMELFADLYGGATAFQAHGGVYRTDDGDLLWDKPIVIESYAPRQAIEESEKVERLADFMRRMGRETKQASVAVVINDTFHEIKNF